MIGLALAALFGIFLAGLQFGAGAPSDRSVDIAAMAAAVFLLAMLTLRRSRDEMARTLRRAGPAFAVCLGVGALGGVAAAGPGAIPGFLEARGADVLLWAACGLAALAVTGATRIAGRRYLGLGMAAAGGAFAIWTTLGHITAISAGRNPGAMTASFGDVNAASGAFAAIAVAAAFSAALETGRIAYRSGEGMPPLMQRLLIPVGAAGAAGLALVYVGSASASLVTALCCFAIAAGFALRKRGGPPAAAAGLLGLGFAALAGGLAVFGAPLFAGFTVRGSIADVAVPVGALLASLFTILAGRDARRTPSRGLGVGLAVAAVATLNAFARAPLLESPAAVLSFACLLGLALSFADPPQSGARGQSAGVGRGARSKASAVT